MKVSNSESTSNNGMQADAAKPRRGYQALTDNVIKN
jgi:hypothetical protein